MAAGSQRQPDSPEQNLQFSCTTGRLLALEGDGPFVGPLPALLQFLQHVFTDVRPLVGRRDLVHAAEGGRLSLAAACVHRGEVDFSCKYLNVNVSVSIPAWLK